MKKIKALLRKIKAKATLSTYQKPLLVTILSLLFINLIVLVVSSIVALFIDGDYFNNNFFSAFANSCKWMLTPNSITQLDPQTQIGLMLLAAIVIAIEMVLFSGAIVATLTTALRTFVDKKSQAKGKIDVENHFVILNWNSKVPEMIYNLLSKGYKNNVLILSDKNKEYVTLEVESVKSSYGERKDKNKINLIVKEGNPLLHGNLEDISIEKASNIVVMAREDMMDGEDQSITNSDLNALKIVLALGNFNINKECNVVVETERESAKNQIENISQTISSLKDKSITPVSFNKKIGQVIAQSVVDPELANIYLDLLSYDGCEFYSSTLDMNEEEYLLNYSSAIPIKKMNNLFVLAETEKDIYIKRLKEYNTSRFLKFKEYNPQDFFTVFVIGDNKKSKFIMENLKLFTEGYQSKIALKKYSKQENEKLIEDVKATKGRKKILILSDDSVSDDSLDSNVFVSLIALETAFKEKDELSFITELLDSRNLNSVKDFNIKNAIISNRLMSLLITQLALNKNSKEFFENLLITDTKEGGEIFDIKVNKVHQVLELDQDLTFKSKAELIHSFYNSIDKKCMLIGIVKGDDTIYLCNNQDKEYSITLEENDLLIYIKY